MLVNVRQRYKSSTRIDGELLDSKRFIDDFILHGTAVNVLETISRDFKGNEQRAYTITGPYGSGKSTIALFLSLLLSTNSHERIYAENALDCSEGTNSDFPSRFKVSKGWKTIKHVCAMESPAHAILRSISDTLKIKIKKDDLTALSDNDCIDKIRHILDSEMKAQDGILILLDEMGKALDYCSNENKDLYIFQQLADIAQQSKNKVILIGFLHQSFTEYAKNKDSKLQEDWAKVQGRYRDLGYNPSVDESLFLLGDAISKSSEELSLKLSKTHHYIVEVVNKAFSSKTRTTTDLTKTLPLDPLVSLLLGPISRRRFSQNERSLFGFLASYEKYGFREFLAEYYFKDGGVLELYSIDNLWSYLHHNLYHVIVTSADSKAWLESCDAVDRASKKGTQLHSSVTKVVSLLTLFGFNQHFHANRSFLVDYFVTKGYPQKKILRAIDDLETWTVIIFRPAHDGFFIFEGSDIDINSLINHQKSKLEAGVDWTSVCEISDSVLATSYYHQTGTMRWANKTLISSIENTKLKTFESKAIHGKSFLTFVVPVTEKALEHLLRISAKNKYIVIGKPPTLSKLKDLAIELIALEKAKKEEDVVVRDKIALRELEARIIAFRQALVSELERIFISSTWTYLGKHIERQPLSSVASLIAHKIFHKAPSIINELINKDKPSGSANAAIRKLLRAMSENEAKRALGLPEQTFPAEKGLYYSTLYNFGLHQEDNNANQGFQFVMPTKATSPLKVLFDDTLSLIENTEGIVRADVIFKMWGAEPYGLAKGIIPIWLLALLQSNNHQLAFYDFNGLTSKPIFIDGADEEFAMKLLQQPELIGVQMVKVDHSTTYFLNEIANALPKKPKTLTPLTIAQSLVTFYSELSPWTRSTKTLDKQLLKFRDETKIASDPNDYLFVKLPKVFGEDTAIENISADDIRLVLDQLKQAHEKQLLKFEERIREYITFNESLAKHCKKIAKYTTHPKVETFALRLSEFASSKNWVTAVISLLSGKAERNWDDKAISKANSELIEVIERFKRDLYLADFGDVNYREINEKFSRQLSGIEKNIKPLDPKEKKAVLMTLLDKLMEA